MKEEGAYVVSISVSKGGIPKTPVNSCIVSLKGLKGDGHNHDKHNSPLQAISLQDIEELEELNTKGYSLIGGMTGENLTVRNLNVNNLSLGTRLKFSGGVIIELTKVRAPCYVLDAIHPKLKRDIADCCGMYAKVICDGIIHVNEIIRPMGQSRLVES